MKRLFVISHPSSAEADDRLMRLAEWMGVSAEHIPYSALETALSGGKQGERCIAMSSKTAAVLHEASSQALARLIEEGCAQMLVFHEPTSKCTNEVIAALSDSKVLGLSTTKTIRSFRLPREGGAFSRQLAGQEFQVREDRPVAAFQQCIDDGSVTQILLAEQRPVFLRLLNRNCELFLASVAQVPDVNQELGECYGIEQYYDQLLPFLIFLRHSFGVYSWHAPAVTARFIIDDPLLSGRYGCLDYAELSRSMQSVGYGTSIAFIPWNYWRTTRKTATQVLQRGPNLSLCVHGCDHTNREFEECDQDALESRAATALARMKKHQNRTGAAFDPVMVFPQGRFSGTAPKALRASHYLAAVNTSCFPSDGSPVSLQISDFLRPAVTRFDGFPIFQRRYPRRIIDCAFDMFVGKPVLLVEHHQYFRDGYEQLEKFTGELNRIEPKLTWPGLAAQLTESCVTRVTSDKCAETQFFTRKFIYTNDRSDNTTIRMWRHEPNAAYVSDCKVNGIRVPFWFEADRLVLQAGAGAGETLTVEIFDQPTPQRQYRRTFSYQVGVSVRRALSEFRDTTLVKHPSVLQFATTVATYLKATGGKPDDPGDIESAQSANAEQANQTFTISPNVQRSGAKGA